MSASGWLEPVYTAEEMREAEATYSGPTLDLMERAGEAVAASVERRYPDARRVSIWCGPGANGGDGLVVARLLHAAGRAVEVLMLAEEARIRGDALENLRRARAAGVAFRAEAGGADVVVDALFGTGFTGVPRRDAGAAIEMINASQSPVVSVDVPSGIDASTGEVSGVAVRASATVTFHGVKLGLVVAPGRFEAGEIEVADIGLEHESTASGRVGTSALELVPRRRPSDNKYTAGSVLVVGGSAGFTGAVCLSCEAALRAGAGIVFACVPASVAPWVDQRLLEVVTRACEDDSDGRFVPEAAETVLEVAARAGAVAIGPGLGRGPGTRELVRLLLERLELPVVVDADALWALAGHLEWAFARERPTVLTPHAGELARLLDQRSARVSSRRLDVGPRRRGRHGRGRTPQGRRHPRRRGRPRRSRRRSRKRRPRDRRQRRRADGHPGGLPRQGHGAAPGRGCGSGDPGRGRGPRSGALRVRGHDRERRASSRLAGPLPLSIVPLARLLGGDP